VKRSVFADVCAEDIMYNACIGIVPGGGAVRLFVTAAWFCSRTCSPVLDTWSCLEEGGEAWRHRKRR
jgi:hypothetical protein